MTKIQPGPSFRENLQHLPPVTGLARIDLLDATGNVIATIENEPGKQGSLAVYQYLSQCFDTLDAAAAAHGLDLFAEHTADARNRPGAHPNVDRLIGIVDGGQPMRIYIVAANPA
ncbi:DUF2322 family protein [Asticcacaulis sp. BYS171W]|uniref:DUF2322 family protein n=1 Tax=Asticcacaulis aquaticus TaxID=2984212 RepID=A0ABT5HZ29_9CAUL|nr:DUF2322 family protein [Asticcacaulis aquaticus]MDC7685177.1 DUF2322 family protein [Asticcacaulis aquaticus]